MSVFWCLFQISVSLIFKCLLCLAEIFLKKEKKTTLFGRLYIKGRGCFGYYLIFGFLGFLITLS